MAESAESAGKTVPVADLWDLMDAIDGYLYGATARQKGKSAQGVVYWEIEGEKNAYTRCLEVLSDLTERHTGHRERPLPEEEEG
jgi:hypothetical protein